MADFDSQTVQPNIIRDGEGVSLKEAANYLNDTGLGEAILDLEDDAELSFREDRIADDERSGRIPPGVRERESPKETGLAADKTPLGQSSPSADTSLGGEAPHLQQYAQQQPQQPQPHPVQQAAMALQQLAYGEQQALAELQSLDHNREALIQQHGPGAVVAYESQLQAFLHQVRGKGSEIQNFLGQAQAAYQQAAVEQWQAGARQFYAGMQRDFGVDAATMANYRHRAIELAQDSGMTQQEIYSLDARGTSHFLRLAHQEQQQKTREAKAMAAVQRAKRERARARAAEADTSPRWTHGQQWRPGDGSLAEAADAFNRLKIA